MDSKRVNPTHSLIFETLDMMESVLCEKLRENTVYENWSLLYDQMKKIRNKRQLILNNCVFL